MRIKSCNFTYFDYFELMIVHTGLNYNNTELTALFRRQIIFFLNFFVICACFIAQMGVINIFIAPKEYPKLQSLFFFFQFLLKLGSRPTIFVAFSCFQLFHECLKCFFQCIHQEIHLFNGSKRDP